MKQHFHLTLLDCALLVFNLLAFGTCLTLLTLKGANGPLVFLTIGSGLASAANLDMAYHRAEKICSRNPFPRRRSTKQRPISS